MDVLSERQVTTWKEMIGESFVFSAKGAKAPESGRSRIRSRSKGARNAGAVQQGALGGSVLFRRMNFPLGRTFLRDSWITTSSLSSERTASSYFTGALAKQIGCIEPNVFYGGEFFRWEKYFQLGPPESGVSPGSLAMLAKNPALLQNYEESPPSGTAMHIFMGEGGRLQRISRETSWEEHAPVSFRRAWEESSTGSHYWNPATFRG